MSDSENLCVSCGLCCDGTLIGFVQLDSEEIPALRKIMAIEESSGNGFFLQPCDKLGCDGCTVYSNRPKQCGKFKCGLLTSLEQKELNFDSAIEITQIAKEKKIALEKKLRILPIELKSQSFYFKMIELKKVLQKTKSESSLTQNQIELLSDLNQLNNLLSKKMGISLF